jgi:hypothetical protein
LRDTTRGVRNSGEFEFTEQVVVLGESTLAHVNLDEIDCQSKLRLMRGHSFLLSPRYRQKGQPVRQHHRQQLRQVDALVGSNSILQGLQVRISIRGISKRWMTYESVVSAA